MVRHWKTITLGSVVVSGLLLMAYLTGSYQDALGDPLKDTTPPGTQLYPKSLLSSLDAKRRARGETYRPRTKHLNPDGSAKFFNRLFLESSPYLLQHAHNPVNWYPWGDEAFEKSAQEKKPVLLSIGYSTCHWCHVMEEESFEDTEIAEYINQHYIAIKVDREERPDVDAVYMAAVQAMTGSGGWPMTVWLSSDRKPFYGATYIPPRDGARGARVGFHTILQKLQEVYTTKNDEVLRQGEALVAHISNSLLPPALGENANSQVSPQILHTAIKYYSEAYDSKNGGIGHAPKFPSSLPIRLLLRYHRRTKSTRALEMAHHTLKKMASSGMYDHVAGGFHRYSTDAQWLVPHFEKMLYDNALLALSYLEGYQATRDENLRAVCEDILHYVARDMTSPHGGFYSATDADSLTPSGEREEGYYFTWTDAEIDKVLGASDGAIVRAYYATTKDGNFEGRNILHTPAKRTEVAAQLNITTSNLDATIQHARSLLYKARGARPAPIRDEKILTAWNGLMISAFARAGRVLGEARYIDQATDAARFVRTHLMVNNRLMRSYKDAEAKQPGFLDDFAFLTAGILDLFEATGDREWFTMAKDLDAQLAKNFEDRQLGGFFMTAVDHEQLLVREKPTYDGAEPSGNSVALSNLLRLAEFTSDDSYRQRASLALSAFLPVLTERPAALSEMLLAVETSLDKGKEVVILTGTDHFKALPLLDSLRQAYVPNQAIIVHSGSEDFVELAKSIPLLAGKTARGGAPTAYVCEQGVCKFPTADPTMFLQQLSQVADLP